MKKEQLLFIFLFLLCLNLPAQISPEKFWIQFTDKNNSSFSLSNPADFLSTRAIERRSRQQIPLEQNDLPLNSSYIDSILATGVSIINRSKWFNAITIASDDSLVLNTIASFSFVKKIQVVGKLKNESQKENKFLLNQLNADQLRTGFMAETANDSLNYGISFNQIQMLGGHKLHINGFTGEGKIIAVLDAGFSGVDTIAAFNNLWQNNAILGTRDFVTGDTMVFEDNSHGMYVLSVMGAWLPGFLIGTAPAAQYWLLRTEDAASEYILEEDNWVAAAEFADSAGVDIINSSLGYTTFDDSNFDHTYSDMNGSSTRITIGADIAASKGIVVVNSAGNSGSSDWKYIGAPADGFKVLAVGGVDENQVYAFFSSIGPTFDGRVKPNITAQGQGTIIAVHSSEVFPANGTSFSAPLISGLVACLWQVNPLKTAAEIFEAIEKSAHLYNNPDSLYGHGIPDFNNAALLISDTFTFNKPKDDEFRSFPNPFSNSLTLEYFSKEEQQIKIEVFDFSGKNVFSKEFKSGKNSFSRFTLDESEKWSSGLYLLIYNSPSGRKSHKIIKH
ncbi:MAG: S8 family serine peptidase [Bacteroidetes bacterium]|nr:S8 family serine peptidase [Bacteroidota bacterium]HET6244915.1 S8 family serine peptidase [Bacteroidia bacterium]